MPIEPSLMAMAPVILSNGSLMASFRRLPHVAPPSSLVITWKSLLKAKSPPSGRATIAPKNANGDLTCGTSSATSFSMTALAEGSCAPAVMTAKTRNNAIPTASRR